MEVIQALETLDSLQKTVRKPSKPSSASAMRFAPPAACDIEQLLQWTYGKHQVHRRLEDQRRSGTGVSTGGMDSVMKVHMNWINGGRISGGIRSHDYAPIVEGDAGFDEIHADALTVHRYVSLMDSLAVGMVITHAVLGTRPDSGGPLSPLEPKRNRKGQIEMQRNKGNPYASVLDGEAVDYNRSVLHLRDLYHHWLLALLGLRLDLMDSGLLPHIVIRRPMAKADPWRG